MLTGHEEKKKVHISITSSKKVREEVDAADADANE